MPSGIKKLTSTTRIGSIKLTTITSKLVSLSTSIPFIQLKMKMNKSNQTNSKTNTTNLLTDELASKNNSNHSELLLNSTWLHLNSSARAMQYRDLFKSFDEKKVSSSKVNTGNRNSYFNINKNKSWFGSQLIRPITVVLTFIAVFSLSVGTIAYLTYYLNNSNHRYQSVNVLNLNNNN
jgi:hypothetical protein